MSQPDAESEYLYHYTDAQALVSILTGHPPSLWASEAIFLNDSKEVIASCEVVLEHLNAKISSHMAHPDYGEHYENGMTGEVSILRKAIEFLEGVAKSPANEDRVFVTCFCEDADLLSQWRSYGQGGYAIGFRRELLGKSKPANFTLNYHDDGYMAVAPQVKLRRVVYDDEPSDVHRMMAAAIEEIVPPGVGLARGFGFQIARWASLVASAQIKDSGFKAEKEWRLIYVRRRDGGGSSLGPATDSRPATNFRSVRGLLVPYIPIEINLAAVARIMVGPGGNQDLRVMTVERLIDEMEQPHIEVHRSRLSYRGDSGG